jgi:hypothetical protein
MGERKTLQKEINVRYPALDVEYVVKAIAEGNALRQLSIKRIIKPHYNIVITEAIEISLENLPFSIGVSYEINTQSSSNSFWLVYVYLWDYPIWAYRDKVEELKSIEDIENLIALIKKSTVRKLDEAFGRRD